MRRREPAPLELVVIVMIIAFCLAVSFGYVQWVESVECEANLNAQT